MASRVAIANGNFTTGATWAVADATSLLDSQASNTALTTTFVSSSTFTPGAITVAGICVKVSFRANAPTANAEIRLFNSTAAAAVAGTTVAANIATDMPNSTNFQNVSATYSGDFNGWFYFRFATPVTLLAATLYAVQARITASSNQLSLYRDSTAGNWSRMLITTTTGAPAAGDAWWVIPHITGAGSVTAYTVQMDETAATDYGTASTTIASAGIGNGCALEFVTTGNRLLRLSTPIMLWGTGRLSMGTAASPITGSAILEFDCPSDGAFGIYAWPLSTVDLNGSPRTAGKDVVLALLNTDEAIGQTTLGVDTDTGWLSGDEIIIGATTRTHTQTESKILNGNAGATSLDITVALTAAHSGTAPNQGEVALLTRNVTIRTVTAANAWFWKDGCDAHLVYRWAAFINGGGLNSVQSWELSARVANEIARDRTYEFCAIVDSERPLNGPNVENSTIYMNDCIHRVNQSHSGSLGSVYMARADMTVEGGAFFSIFATASTGIRQVGATVLTMRNVRFCGIGFAGSIATFGFGWFNTIIAENCEFHSNPANSNALNMGAPDRMGVIRISDCKVWRNNEVPVGAFSADAVDALFERCDFRGNATAHVSLPSPSQSNPRYRFVDCDFNSESGFTTANGVQFSTGWLGEAEFQECRFSQVFAHTTNDITRTGTISDMRLRGLILLNRCLTGAPTPINLAVYNSPSQTGRLSIMDENGIAAAHRTLEMFGVIENQAAVFNTAAPCEQLTPNVAAVQGYRGLRSSPVYKPVPAGSSVTFSVWIKRQATHNGAAPEIIVWANGQGGWFDTRATYSGGLDVWQELTVTVGPAIADTVAEACVEVEGTVGAVYIDDWSATVA